MSTTIDLAKFGFREIEMLRDILDALVKHGLPEDFSGEGVHPMFNMNSGNVFLTNEDCQVAMLDGGDKLESFYSCPECGYEGFMGDMENAVEIGYGGKACCEEYVKEI
jgi:hypothetical protein